MKLIIFYWNGTLFDDTRKTLFPGAKETLEELKKRDVMVAIVTWEQGKRVVPYLEIFELVPFLDYRRFELFDQAESIREILAEAGIEAEDCAYVCDNPPAIRSGTRVGVKTIYFRKGGPQDGVAFAGPDFIIERLVDLTKKVDQVRSERKK